MADVVKPTHICKHFFAISRKPLCLLMFHGQSFFSHFAEPPETPVFTGIAAFSPILAVFDVSRAVILPPVKLICPKSKLFLPLSYLIYIGGDFAEK